MLFKIKNIKKTVVEQPKVFNRWVSDRIKKNMNVICIFNGGTGSGKSFASLREGWELSQLFNTPFSIEDNLAFNFDDLLNKIEKDKEHKAGTVYIMEEVGAVGSGAAAREWQSKANRFFSTYLQTQRYLNQIIILNCPSFSYLEKGARELVHFQFEAAFINHKTKRSFFKPFAIQCNRRTGKLYFKYLRFIKNGVKRKMSLMGFELPPQDILEKYQKAKEDYGSNIRNIMLIQQKTIKREENLYGLTARQQEVLHELDNGLSIAQIAQKEGILESNVRKIINVIRAKGVKISTYMTPNGERTYKIEDFGMKTPIAPAIT